METLIQSASRNAERDYQNQQGLQGPYEGLVEDVVGREDAVGISYGPTRNRRMPIPHPFVGSNSWIRSIPDIGSRVLLQNRYDTGQAEIFKTLPIGPFERASSYFDQQSTYRELNPGEHDIASQGLASIYLNRRGGIDMFSGSGVSRRMYREQLETVEQAPTHREQLLLWSPGTIGDEQRLGIVKRWKTPVEEYFVQANEKFLSEHFLQILNPSGAQPTVLLRRTEGHVYDDAGVAIKQFSTQNNLRHQEFLFTDTDEFKRFEVDVNGNSLEVFPTVATIGKEFRIPNGSHIGQIGVDRDMTIDRDERVIVGQNIQYTVGRDVSYNVTRDFDIVAGVNAFTMSNDAGNETVGLVTAAISNIIGFQAQNNSDGGLTAVFGPMNSAMFMTGDGKIQLQDGLKGGITLEGETITTFAASGSALSVGEEISAMISNGKDGFNISDGLVQILGSDGVTVNAKAFNANVGNTFLGKGAAIPAVLGLTLMNWLDQHNHIGNLGIPTGPPIVLSSSLIGTPLSITSIGTFLAPNI